MLPGLVFSGFGSVLNTKLAGQGYPPVTLWAPGLALAANVGLNLWLIPELGLKGAALTASVTYTLWALVVTAAYLRRTGLGWTAFLRSGPPGHTIEKTFSSDDSHDGN
jgi:Na+-driven multidrug efflux pump